MFEPGYLLEEIIYITGIDIKNILQYISMDKILSKKNRAIKWDKSLASISRYQHNFRLVQYQNV